MPPRTKMKNLPKKWVFRGCRPCITWSVTRDTAPGSDSRTAGGDQELNMHRIRFAFCALALIGMAAPASAQGPIRNLLRGRRPSAEPQNVMPATTVTTGTTATTGTPGTTVAGPSATPVGPVAGTPTPATPTTSKYAPAGTPVTPAAASTTTTTVGMPTQQSSTGRRGIFGLRRSRQPVSTETVPMTAPAPSNIGPTPVPNGPPKPLPTTIGEKGTTPGATPATATVTTGMPAT